MKTIDIYQIFVNLPKMLYEITCVQKADVYVDFPSKLFCVRLFV